MPLFLVSTAFLFGIILGKYCPLSPIRIYGLILFACLLLILETRLKAFQTFSLPFRERARIPFSLLFLMCFLGCLCFTYRVSQVTSKKLAWYNDQTVSLSGLVSNDPAIREDTTRFVLNVQSVEIDGIEHKVSGALQVMLNRREDIAFGDQLLLYGELRTPPEGSEFSYRDYLASQQIFSYMSYPTIRAIEKAQGNPVTILLFELRKTARQFIRSSLPLQEGSILTGILLGLENDIPPSLYDAYRSTGTAHIIVISGFNIAILAGLFSSLFTRVKRGIWGFVFTMTGVGMYTVLVGGDPPVIRSAIMAALGIFGHMVGRRQSGINSLGFCAAIMALFNPGILWDVSFQLSFAATAGLILFTDPMTNWVNDQLQKRFSENTANRLTHWVGEYFLVTLAAQITTLPVILFHFQRVSPVSLLANVFILPPQPMIMILGGIAVIAGMIFAPLGKLISLPVVVLIRYCNELVKLFEQLPMGQFTPGEASVWITALLIVILLLYILARRYKLVPLLKQGTWMITLFLVCCLTWYEVFRLPDQNLHVKIFNQGNPVTHITTPSGQQMIIGLGDSSREMQQRIEDDLSLFHRSLDVIIMPETNASTYEVLTGMLESLNAGLVLYAENDASSTAERQFMQSVSGREIDTQPLKSGQSVELSGNVKLHVVLHHSLGTSLLLKYEDFSLLMPGTVPADTFQRLYTETPQVILLVEDLSKEAVQDWQNTFPQALLMALVNTSHAVCEQINCLDVRSHGEFELISDGENLWLQGFP